MSLPPRSIPTSPSFMGVESSQESSRPRVRPSQESSRPESQAVPRVKPSQSTIPRPSPPSAIVNDLLLCTPMYTLRIRTSRSIATTPTIRHRRATVRYPPSPLPPLSRRNPATSYSQYQDTANQVPVTCLPISCPLAFLSDPVPPAFRNNALANLGCAGLRSIPLLY